MDRKNHYLVIVLTESKVSEWLLFNTKSANFQFHLYLRLELLTFDEMMMSILSIGYTL